jgi:hypothetical protein
MTTRAAVVAAIALLALTGCSSVVPEAAEAQEPASSTEASASATPSASPAPTTTATPEPTYLSQEGDLGPAPTMTPVQKAEIFVDASIRGDWYVVTAMDFDPDPESKVKEAAQELFAYHCRRGIAIPNDDSTVTIPVFCDDNYDPS